METKVIEKMGKYDTDFETIKWAIGARSTDKIRHNIQRVLFDGGLVVATDGSRLHVAAPERHIDDGLYEVLKETKYMIVLRRDNDHTFPQYERVFPQNTHNGISPLNVPGDKKHQANFVLNHVLKSSDHTFDVEYLLCACPCGERLHFEQGQGTSPLVVRNEDYTKAALVMPLKMKGVGP
jgi:hypothetical protein